LRGKRYLAEFKSSGALAINFNRAEPAVDLSKRGRVNAAATIDEQGLLYMIVGDEILVISQGGEVVRELIPDKPSPKYVMEHIQAAKGKVAIWFFIPERGKRATVRLAIVDPESGDILRVYEPDEELGNNAVCFTGDAFTFFRVRDGYVHLLTADVR
jgi:hypothetical protein